MLRPSCVLPLCSSCILSVVVQFRCQCLGEVGRAAEEPGHRASLRAPPGKAEPALEQGARPAGLLQSIFISSRSLFVPFL